jgi:uncharacterized protein YqjF (DUF2071 family)
MLIATESRRVEATEQVARPLFLADWCEMFFMHFAVAPEMLQPRVPLEVDLFDGKAYLSLVAFTQRNLRPAFGGRIAAALLSPLASHEFLNLRTYVRAAGTTGIYFLSEWIPNRLAELIGPRMYGLPYHHGQLRYDNTIHRCVGRVRAGQQAIQYAATPSHERRQARAGELEHFLLERYSAFTWHHGTLRRFDVEHERWTFSPARVERFMPDLLSATLPWLGPSLPAIAQFSTGVRDVKIGQPQIIPLARRAPSLTPRSKLDG